MLLSLLAAAAVAAPQSQDVSIDAAGVALAATLSPPREGSHPVPGVVLVHGSGPHTRDAPLFAQLNVGFGVEGRCSLSSPRRWTTRATLWFDTTRRPMAPRRQSLRWTPSSGHRALSSAAFARAHPQGDASSSRTLRPWEAQRADPQHEEAGRSESSVSKRLTERPRGLRGPEVEDPPTNESRSPRLPPTSPEASLWAPTERSVRQASATAGRGPAAHALEA